jgi:hypothetical protein
METGPTPSPAGRVCLKNYRRASTLILPLVVVFTLLVFVTADNRAGKALRRKSADEEQDPKAAA